MPKGRGRGKERSTDKRLGTGDANLNRAMIGDNPVMLYKPTHINGKKVQEVTVVRTHTVSIKENVLRITEHADPIGFLMAVQNGQIFEYQIIKEDGEIKTYYEQATLAQRIGVARFLADKAMPRMSLVKISDDSSSGGQGGAPQGGGDGGRSFSQIVERAAQRQRQIAALGADAEDSDYESDDETDSGEVDGPESA
jgi:hypothetical protein